jgi:hypothetical protein
MEQKTPEQLKQDLEEGKEKLKEAMGVPSENELKQKLEEGKKILRENLKVPEAPSMKELEEKLKTEGVETLKKNILGQEKQEQEDKHNQAA